MTFGAYKARALEPLLRQSAVEFPAVVLTGPRQCGKTTLLQHVFGATHRYVSLEPPDVRAAASADPRGFLAAHGPPLILDEVQYAPDLLPYIKEAIDSRRSVRGRYILTGSQNLLLSGAISETLAGRAAMLRLLPLSRREIRQSADVPLPWESPDRHLRKRTQAEKLWPELLAGYYPEIVVEPGRNVWLWHASYVQTYLDRDVRGLRQIGDLTQFQSFLRVLASRSGQLLNVTDISRDLGIAVNTVKAWLSILEATYQVIVLRPYHSNTGKRLVKTPKVYFTDTGTLAYLVGLKDATHAASGPMAGGMFETAVIAEMLKVLVGRGEDPRLYFWRTSTGVEVDLIVESGQDLIPIEIKSTSTPRPEMAASIQTFQKDFRNATQGYVVHSGDVSLPLAPRVSALPFDAL